jgi:phospho-N-acetylmuramoyl-pentapeptide-transferase
MLYHLLYSFHAQFSVLNVTRYITFRTAAASLTALAIGLALGPLMIRKLRQFQIGQVIRHEGPATHRPKAGTPTMGGLLILTSAIVPTLLWADLSNPYVWIATLTLLAFGLTFELPLVLTFMALLAAIADGTDSYPGDVTKGLVIYNAWIRQVS